MQPPQDPFGNEEPTPAWVNFALNVGLKLAETFGLGLTLFNAMRARFEGVSASVIGDIVSTIGQAVRAATGLTSDELNQSIPLGDLPQVPASFHPGDPGDRVLAAVDVTGAADGKTVAHPQRVWVNGQEYNTPQEMIDAANQLYIESLDETDPKAVALIVDLINQLVFLAKRF